MSGPVLVFILFVDHSSAPHVTTSSFCAQVVLNLLGCDAGAKIGGTDKTVIGMELFLAVAAALQATGERRPPAPLLHEILPSGRRVRNLPPQPTALLTREACDECGLAPYVHALPFQAHCFLEFSTIVLFIFSHNFHSYESENETFRPH